MYAFERAALYVCRSAKENSGQGFGSCWNFFVERMIIDGIYHLFYLNMGWGGLSERSQ
jgi:hypothetical protein